MQKSVPNNLAKKRPDEKLATQKYIPQCIPILLLFIYVHNLFKKNPHKSVTMFMERNYGFYFKAVKGSI